MNEPQRPPGRPKQMDDSKLATWTVHREQAQWINDQKRLVEGNWDKLPTDEQKGTPTPSAAAIVRGIIAALQAARIDFSTCSSEAEVTEHLVAKLKGRPVKRS